ncbi:MAG: response regulator [Methanoregula sp.]
MEKTRILVVEDELIVAENLKVTLAGMGYDVPETACNSDEAFQQAGELCPDLILMDIVLEGSTFDGVETARRIRALHDIPVIFVTAYADDETLERVKVTEPFAYILKPFNERELYSAIELALHRHRMEREIKKRDTILFAIGFAVEWFLRFQKESKKAKDGKVDMIEAGIQEILEQIGFAVDADMVSVFQMNPRPEKNSSATIQYVWTAPDASIPPLSLHGGDLQMTFTTSLWRALLSSGNPITGSVKRFPTEERQFFEKCGVSSIAILPLFKSDELWGFVGFSDANTREWSDGEMEALTIAGNIVGAVLE